MCVCGWWEQSLCGTRWYQHSDSVQVSSLTPIEWQWLPTHWQCKNIYWVITTWWQLLYKYLQWHQHSDSIQVSTVTPIQWQCTSKYSDTNTMNVYKYPLWLLTQCPCKNIYWVITTWWQLLYKYLQWHQHSDSIQVSTVTPIQWQCTSKYSDTNTMNVYKYPLWLLTQCPCKNIYWVITTWWQLLYKYLQWHQHSDSIQVSTVTPIQWQCTSKYSDTNTMNVYKYPLWLLTQCPCKNIYWVITTWWQLLYKYLQWHQHSDSIQVSTVTPIQWQCTSKYSDTNTMNVYKYPLWLLTQCPCKNIYWVITTWWQLLYKYLQWSLHSWEKKSLSS